MKRSAKLKMCKNGGGESNIAVPDPYETVGPTLKKKPRCAVRSVPTSYRIDARTRIRFGELRRRVSLAHCHRRQPGQVGASVYHLYHDGQAG